MKGSCVPKWFCDEIAISAALTPIGPLTCLSDGPSPMRPTWSFGRLATWSVGDRLLKRHSLIGTRSFLLNSYLQLLMRRCGFRNPAPNDQTTKRPNDHEASRHSAEQYLRWHVTSSILRIFTPNLDGSTRHERILRAQVVS